jgi:host factor-I protein
MKAKTKAPEQTLEETRYLRQLVDQQTMVRVRLTSNEEVEGRVEFFDLSFIRLTRDQQPNLFIFKHDIKYLYEAESHV